MNKNVIKMSKELSRALYTDKRTDGGEFVKLHDGSPEWMTEAIHEVHNKLGSTLTPHDTIYAFIDRAAGAFADADEDSDSSDIIFSMEPDVYTHDLTAWLHESVDHVFYLTQALEDFGPFDDGFALLGAAQQIHVQEVAETLYSVLEAQADPDDDNDDDDPDDDDGPTISAPVPTQTQADLEAEGAEADKTIKALEAKPTKTDHDWFLLTNLRSRKNAINRDLATLRAIPLMGQRIVINHKCHEFGGWVGIVADYYESGYYAIKLVKNASGCGVAALDHVLLFDHQFALAAGDSFDSGTRYGMKFTPKPIKKYGALSHTAHFVDTWIKAESAICGASLDGLKDKIAKSHGATTCPACMKLAAR